MRRGLALLLVACGTGSAAAPANENSGVEVKTRLRAHVWSADDAEQLRWFYDSKRKEDCSFVENGIANTGPGPTYWCLPRNSVRHDATGGLAIFADKGCTVPLALALANPAAPAAYVIARGASSCVEPPRVFHAEAPQSLKPYVFDGTKCVQATATIATQALGEEIPLGSFVSAVETVTPLEGTIAKLDLVGSDGSRQTIGGFDRAQNLSVAVGDPGAAGDQRWFPTRLAFEGAGSAFYSDDACTTTVGTKVARDALCPLDASFEFDAKMCGNGTYYALGAAVDATTLHTKTALACVATSASSAKGVVAYARGNAFDRKAFVAAQRTDRGAGRIHELVWRDGVSDVMSTDFYDAQLGEVCTPDVGADALTRCLPGDSASVALWSDAACTLPAYEEPKDGCAEKPVPKWVRSEGKAYRVKATATQLYERAAGAAPARSPKACIVHKPVVDSRFFEVEEADLAQFALVTEATR